MRGIIQGCFVVTLSHSKCGTLFIYAFVKQEGHYLFQEGERGGMDGHQAEMKEKANNIPTSSDIMPAKMECPSCPLVSIGLLRTFRDRMRPSGVKLIEQTSPAPCNTSGSQAVSTQGIMKIAWEKLLKYASRGFDIFSIIAITPDSQSGLFSEDNEDVDIALLLLASAEKLAIHKFDRAWKLLHMCASLASPTGNPVQRVVYYFSQALREKIDQERGVNPPGQGEEKKQMDVEQFLARHIPAMISAAQELPLIPVTQFTGIQAILDNLGSATRIHLIDLGIKIGTQWTILLQAFSIRHEFPVEHLKITAVGTYRDRLETTGGYLLSFAQEMKLPFPLSFKVVESDMKDLKKDLFEVEDGEAVAIYSNLRLWSLLRYPNHLEALLKVIKSLNPSLMVVTEAEVNLDRLNFLDRFYELLFATSAFFDCLDSCMERDNQARLVIEGLLLSMEIQNVIATEGEERIFRYEKIDFWRGLFARFGMVETELSESSLHQAGLILKRFPRWSGCSLEMNGQCLIEKWKGTPLLSLSAWKFQQEEKTK